MKTYRFTLIVEGTELQTDEHVDALFESGCDDALIGATDAARTGLTRESVRLLIKGARGPGGFPAPVTDPRSRYRLWRWSEVQDWMRAAFGEPLSDPDLSWYEAINASLELRRSTPHLPDAKRRNLQSLAGL